MKISIAMATYNGAKYLQEQLDSFASQTRQPDELIITDDGSIDNTIQIIEDFSKKAPFHVRWSQNEKKLGYAGNFSKALSLTTGELVFLSDQDDIWFRKKIETIEKVAMQDNRTQLIINDAVLVFEDLTPTGLTKLSQIRSAGLSDRSFLMGCCMAVRRGFLRRILPIPSAFTAHDSWIAGFAEGLGRKRIVTEPLQYYRRHKNNTSQFVANQTRKINRYDRLVSQFRKALTDPGYRDLSRSYDNLSQFIYRAEAWARCSEDEILKRDLESFIKKTEKTKRHIKDRIGIKKHGRLLRVFYAARLLYAGTYKESGGVQCYLRDILF